MPKWERSLPFDFRKPKSDEQMAKEVSLKTWRVPKVRRPTRVEYCAECDCVHGKGRHVKK